MTSFFRNLVADYLWIKAVRDHRSRMGRREAPRYSHYLAKARGGPVVRSDKAEITSRAADFRAHGWSSFSDAEAGRLAKSMLGKIKAQEASGLDVWGTDNRYQLGEIYQCFPEVEQFLRGTTGEFLREVYGAEFKVFYGVCYRSAHKPGGPKGSQQWHADGGPGTCINLMWCLSPVSPSNGAMECLSWDDSVRIFGRERKAIRAEAAAGHSNSSNRRDMLSSYYKSEIEDKIKPQINQPAGDAGLVFAFSNNVLHKGGYTQPNHERYVCVFHIYPSAVPTPFDRYRSKGIGKEAGYPQDPAFGDGPL